jgi:hypothetical protein
MDPNPDSDPDPDLDADPDPDLDADPDPAIFDIDLPKMQTKNSITKKIF